MTMYVYSTDGDPVGFVFETSIYDLDGTPLGRICGCRVHRFDGTYVGEWFRDMVVRRPSGRPRIIPPTATPPRREPAIASYRLRAVVDYGYPNAFPLLRQGAGTEAWFSEAAE
ncbi:MAG: 4-fold beta flower protein [Allosphingosinicella sp.]